MKFEAVNVVVKPFAMSAEDLHRRVSGIGLDIVCGPAGSVGGESEDFELIGATKLDDKSAEFYGMRYMLCESSSATFSAVLLRLLQNERGEKL